jgi:hypothetical protein
LAERINKYRRSQIIISFHAHKTLGREELTSWYFVISVGIAQLQPWLWSNYLPHRTGAKVSIKDIGAEACGQVANSFNPLEM